MILFLFSNGNYSILSYFFIFFLLLLASKVYALLCRFITSSLFPDMLSYYFLGLYSMLRRCFNAFFLYFCIICEFIRLLSSSYFINSYLFSIILKLDSVWKTSFILSITQLPNVLLYSPLLSLAFVEYFSTFLHPYSWFSAFKLS